MSWIADAQHRLSRETGTIVKDWGGRLPVALVYPNSYYIGMSNLGIQAIYSLLNGYPDVVCERIFLDRDKRGKPSMPLSLESGRPLSDFPVIAFSVTYELDFFNVVSVLKESGLPLNASERNAGHPLVIAGGACITANPMPLAPFFDCLCIGDAEAILPKLIPTLREGAGGKREELLETLAGLPGIYVPRTNQKNPVERQWARHLDEFPVHSAVLTADTELGGLYLIEVERGCSWGCRFCMVGTAFSPMRFRSVDNLLAQAEEGLKYRRRIGLIGPAVCDHPKFEEIISKLRGLGAEISISSLRIKPFSGLALAEMQRSGARTIALAPEAGSQRLRDVIRKNITEDDILSAVRLTAAGGVRQLKLYFMLGLPTETDEDIAEMVRLALACKDAFDKEKPGGRITLSVSCFVPKAGTPFQWLPMERLETLEGRISRLKDGLAGSGIDVRAESSGWSQVQAVLAKGGPELAPALVATERVSLAGWRKALEKSGVDIDSIIYREWDTGRVLPWSAINSGLPEGRLESELRRAVLVK